MLHRCWRLHDALHVVERLKFLFGIIASRDRRSDIDGSFELNLAVNRFDLRIDKFFKSIKRAVISGKFAFFRAEHHH